MEHTSVGLRRPLGDCPEQGGVAARAPTPSVRNPHRITPLRQLLRPKVALGGALILLALGLGGLWLISGPLRTDLRGRWEKETGGYVMLRFTEQGVRIHQPQNCEGWPGRSAQDVFDVAVRPGVLDFPAGPARQRYQVLGLGLRLVPHASRLVIRDSGPIPPGTYTYIRPNLVGPDGRAVFEDVGLCSIK